MLSRLSFETAGPIRQVAPARTDIACFIGYIARRPGSVLPQELIDALRLGGWVDGPWHRADPALQSLENLPVAVESWNSFAHLYAWESRPLQAAGNAVCATYLGSAVRSFFANGGRRAIIIRVADPFPFLEALGNRAAQRNVRLHRLIPALADGINPLLPFNPYDPGQWHGIEHLYGLSEVSHLCLPDLADICAVDPAPARTAFAPPPAPEVFVECSQDETVLPMDQGLSRLSAPRCDLEGFAQWQLALEAVGDFIYRHRRDTLFVGAVPLANADALQPQGGTTVHAEFNWLGFLENLQVLKTFNQQPSPEKIAAASHIQLVWPWLHTRRSADLPEALEPPDGLFAGLLAHNALTRGTFRSVGGSVLDDVIGLTPQPPAGIGADSPLMQLAERICVIATEPDGHTIQSDVTTSPDPAWQFGGTRRLIAAIRREATRFGEAHVFEPNGPALWASLRQTLDSLLLAFWQEGAFGGKDSRAAFQVRCDLSTMSQSDLDNGRLIAEISVLPAMAITRITVVLDMVTDGGAGRTELRQVA